MLRFCGPEDDEDEELIEEHVTKVHVCVRETDRLKRAYYSDLKHYY